MKKVYFLIFVLLAAFVLSIATIASEISVIDENGCEYVDRDGAFSLPSHIEKTAVTFTFSEEHTVEIKDENGDYVQIEDGQVLDLTPYLTTNTGEEIYILFAKVDSIKETLVFRFATNLPSVYVTTSQGAETVISTNGRDDSAKVTITNSDGTREYFDTEETVSQIKVRGNTTPYYAKKPFQLKLSSGADIFNMGKAKSWILLADYLDQSLLRNSVMYYMGSVLGMDTSAFKSVDLYIDGEYYGIYLFCEKVQINNDRVNIFDLEEATDLLNESYDGRLRVVRSGTLINETILSEYRFVSGITNPEDITGGYLVELDNNYYEDELCYFVTENGNHYVIKSPEYCSREQVEYIARLFAEMEEAILSPTGENSKGAHYSEYIDVDSFAYAYIIAEFGRNYDAGSSSIYFYKDKDVDGVRSKIVKGPLWDCDNTLGNIHKNGASEQEGYWAKERCNLWSGLMAKNEFFQRVSEIFASNYDEILNIIEADGFIDQHVSYMGNSIRMNTVRWQSNDYGAYPVYYDGTHYDRWTSGQTFAFFEKYHEQENEESVIGYLKSCIRERAEWMYYELDCESVREEITPPPSGEEAPPANENIDNRPTLDNMSPTNEDIITRTIITAVISIVAVLAVGIFTAIVIIKRKKH